ncbi:hypothetical protein [Streptomyces sp. NPDC005498]|uniref:hypothetical protein n=1 Tax=Streptomyces sp. NPDC005498 TaxID=3364717 RepID=UPI00367D43C9
MNGVEVPPGQGAERPPDAGGDPSGTPHGEPTLWEEALPWVDDASGTTSPAPGAPRSAVHESGTAAADTWDGPADVAASGNRPRRRGARRIVVTALACAGVATALVMMDGRDGDVDRGDALPPLGVVGREQSGPPTFTYEVPSPAAPSTSEKPVVDGDRPTPAASPTPSAGHDTPATRATTAGEATTTTAASAAPREPSVIRATAVLGPGRSVRGGKATLTMTSGGDLVVTDERGATRWSSHTVGTGFQAVFQDDGNLAVYNPGGDVQWSSRTDGHPGAALMLMPDGNVRIQQGGSVLWQTGTGH